MLFTSAAPAVASPSEWPPTATALEGDEEVALVDARSEPQGTPGPPVRGLSGCVLGRRLTLVMDRGRPICALAPDFERTVASCPRMETGSLLSLDQGDRFGKASLRRR